MPKARTPDTTEATLRQIVVEVMGTDEVGPNDTFETLGFDSLDRVEFWMMVEDVYFGGRELPEEEVQKLDSWQKVVAYVDQKRNNGKDGQ